MIKQVYLFWFLVISLTIQGQELRNRFGDVYYTADMHKTKYNAPESTPYLNEVFTPAKINNINETKMVRFDAFEDRVEIMVSENKVVILEDKQPYSIKLLDGSGKLYETKSYYDEKGNTKASFFEVLALNENYSVYLKEKMKFSKAKKAQGYEASKPAMFKKQKATHYITDFKGESDQLIKIPTKVKYFIEFFPGHSKSLKMFIKDNKLKIDKSQDLMKIFDFYFDTN
ncbi:MAG: hypothetical protein GY931_01850 [Maribacter sp.]|nr:hypothetical protein [Maribacter sp.]